MMVKRIVASWLLAALALGPPVSLEAQATDADLAKGILQVQSGDFEAALTTLDAVVRRLAGQRGATSDLARADVYLGMAYLGLEQEPAARARFQDAWRADKGMKPSASEFPPRILRLLEEARKEVLSASPARTTPEPQPSPQPAAGADSSATAPKKGRSKLPLVLVGVAAVGGGLALASKKTDPRDADADKDGVSINQGDCNDNDPQIKPNAGFSFTVDFVFTGTISCAQRNTRPQTYRIQNNSCSPLTVQSLRATAGGVGNCTFQDTANLPLSATTVGAGSSATIRTAAGTNTATALCCSNPPCAIGNCTISEQFTVTTSAGAQTVTNSFVVTDPTGRTCSACADVVSANSNGSRNAQCTFPADHR